MLYKCIGCQRSFQERRGYSIHARQCRSYQHAIKQRLERQIEVDLPVDAVIVSQVPDDIQEEVEEILPVSTAI